MFCVHVLACGYEFKHLSEACNEVPAVNLAFIYSACIVIFVTCCYHYYAVVTVCQFESCMLGVLYK